MIVKELIEMLSKYDPKIEVVVYIDETWESDPALSVHKDAEGKSILNVYPE